MKTLFSALVVMLVSVSAGVTAQGDRGYVPITPKNADQVVQVAALERVDVTGVFWSTDGEMLFVSLKDGGIWSYDAADLEAEPRLIIDAPQWTLSAVINPDGSLIATDSAPSGGASQIHLWDVATGDLLRVFGYSEGGWDMEFSPDGSLLASNIGFYRISLWDVTTGKLIASEDAPIGWIPSHGPYIWALDYSPDGSMVAFTTEYDEVDSVVIWQVEPEPQPIWGCLVDERDTDYHYIAFSPDSATLAVSVGRSVRLIDVATGETIRSFGHEAREGFWCIAFSPDGAILATGGTDSTIQLWDMMTGEILTSLDDHTDWVDWIAFNSDGTLLASFGRDNTIRLWGISSPISGQNGLTP